MVDRLASDDEDGAAVAATTDAALLPGTCPVRFKGQLNYEVSTQRLVDLNPGVDLSAEMAAKTKIIVETIEDYAPFDDMICWLESFTDSLSTPYHQDTIDRILNWTMQLQLNRYQPGSSAPRALLNTLFDQSSEDTVVLSPEPQHNENNELANGYLSIAEDLAFAPYHPDIVLTYAAFLAAHRPFFENLKAEVEFAHQSGKLNSTKAYQAQYVISNLSDQFSEFIILETFMPMTFIKRNEITGSRVDRHTYRPAHDSMPTTLIYSKRYPCALEITPHPDHRQVVADAITEAGKVLLPRAFSANFGVGWMGCPGRKYMRQVLARQILQGIHKKILDNAHDPAMQKMLYKAHRAATNAVYYPGCQYYKYKGAVTGDEAMERFRRKFASCREEPTDLLHEYTLPDPNEP